ncbi:hypothetical protein EKO23_12850 [Nocardioides guangzhouensis]|uniref:WD40 repeat domain-containing protein n=1 Tax=Nocardioides guangzhouensis TaxID=2497878 RepID=A0A4Q4ZCP0_9ACTN|nr:hypothetical protein [Nocardioides guangzhouensis]RYP85365.1 hypothetical protein EKO23_12850 [Nocardioides guangzhouensis]
MRRWYAAAAVLLLLAAGCSGDGSGDGSREPDGPTTGSGPTSAATDSPTGPVAGSPTGTATAEPTAALLDWRPLGKPDSGTWTRGEDWTMRVADGGTSVRFDGPAAGGSYRPGPGRHVVDAFLDGDRAVLVSQDRLEEKPLDLVVLDLPSGDRVGRVTDPRPGTGGSVAYGEGTLVYSSFRPGGAFCLAAYDVEAGRGEKGYCAPRRHGFSNASISPAGTGLMTFDARRPVSCRTLTSVTGATATPLPGVPDCKGWDVLLTDGGAVWSTVPKEQRVEAGQFYATTGDTVTALGPGTTGTLLWCGDSAYFVRDAQKDLDKARLMRWTPDGELQVVYESSGEGEAFLAAPACADGILTVRSFAEGGDEQVWATAPG